ncbi:hypothetical protein TKK_0000997 [Trichogramma kaykai]
MEDLRTVEKLVARGYYMRTIDIEDAFHSISIHEDSRKYLRFIFEEDFEWWIRAARVGKNPIRYGDYKLEIYTDASLSGWGAHANNVTTNGFWNATEKEWHINCLELKAIFLGLKCFTSNMHNCEILLRCDNEHHTSVVTEDVPDGRSIIRQAFKNQGHSEDAIKILVASLATSTVKQYSSSLIDWWKFCKDHDTDPFNSSNHTILKFLTKKFDKGASYGTINTARSAISLISAYDLSNDPMISRFLKGVFKLRPQTAKYSSSWDPEVVFDYIEKLPEPLTLQEISEKTLILLALCTAHRAQTFALIDINNISNLGTELQIKIPDLIKTSKPGTRQPNLILPFFRERPKLCAASTLLKYIEMSKDFRQDESNLFISTRKPYKSIGSQTISRWIKNILTKAGIDTSRFTGHSTRHASSSTACRKGIDIRTIKQTAGWSEKSTIFAKFYNQPVEKSNVEFANLILKK